MLYETSTVADRILATHPLEFLRNILVCIVLMPPILIIQSPLLGTLVKISTVIMFVGMTGLFLLKREKVSSTFWMLVLYFCALLIPTIINQGSYLSWGYSTLSKLALFMFVQYEFRRGTSRASRLLRVISDLFLLYLAINYFMIIDDGGLTTSWGRSGYVEPVYFLGIRTRITDCIFPAILASALYDFGGKNRLGMRTVSAMLFGIVQMATLAVSTAYVGMFVMVLVFILVATGSAAGSFFSMRNITILGIALAIAVVGFRIQRWFAFVISDVLGESMALTGRTDIWDSAIPIIRESPIIGYGIDDNFGAFAVWRGGILWQAHNQYLQIWHDGGIIALGCFIGFLLLSGHGVDRSSMNRKSRAALVSVYAALTVMGVTEIFTYNMGLFFLVMFISAEASGLPCARVQRGDSCTGPEGEARALHKGRSQEEVVN